MATHASGPSSPFSGPGIELRGASSPAAAKLLERRAADYWAAPTPEEPGAPARPALGADRSASPMRAPSSIAPHHLYALSAQDLRAAAFAKRPAFGARSQAEPPKPLMQRGASAPPEVASIGASSPARRKLDFDAED